LFFSIFVLFLGTYFRQIPYDVQKHQTKKRCARARASVGAGVSARTGYCTPTTVSRCSIKEWRVGRKKSQFFLRLWDAKKSFFFCGCRTQKTKKSIFLIIKNYWCEHAKIILVQLFNPTLNPIWNFKFFKCCSSTKPFSSRPRVTSLS
jgi:hypothetical protein